jgi:cellulose biosynthesis protein BcsQ
MEIYAFWNNKGGTGKTSMTFQAICHYAHVNPEKRVLAVDVCPQANLSELLLGGIQHRGSDNLLQIQGGLTRATIGGYFQSRLPSPFSPPEFSAHEYITKPNDYNEQIPDNVRLLCGDPILELQSNAISTLANTNLAGVNSWVAIIDWLKDFLQKVESDFDVVFIDTNPSFSMYTQIALSTADRLVLPVMADDSSRRAIQNVFSLIYGLTLPSPIYAQYAFAAKLEEAGRQLPKVHLIIKNRITQYMGSASAYATVLKAIDSDITDLIKDKPELFSFNELQEGMVNVRDFQTAGVVAHARGCPLYSLKSGNLEVLGKRVQVNDERRKLCVDDIAKIVEKI